MYLDQSQARIKDFFSSKGARKPKSQQARTKEFFFQRGGARKPKSQHIELEIYKQYIAELRA